MGFPYACLGAIALLLPRCLTDAGYSAVSKHRGNIWKFVKKTFGWGETYLTEHRASMRGVDFDVAPKSWGLADVLAEERAKPEQPCSCFDGWREAYWNTGNKGKV
mmetsp:Transcript_113085/g.320018  ORF Transcript_113085/g.320018 Transcript_113085/m.320018 type:complete len:105 (+) Transcript_113085:230-544(+)